MMRRSSSGMGGGRMLRAMGRAMGAGVKEKLSAKGQAAKHATKPARLVSLSSPPPSTPPASLLNGKAPLSCYCGDLDEWEAVGDDHKEFAERCVFGPTPTEEEAEEAVSTIRQIFSPVTFSQVAEDEYFSMDDDVVDKVVTSTDLMHIDCLSDTESDWIEPAVHLCSSKPSPSYGRESLLDAIHMLEINPPFKRMVTSLTSDPAVWDAVMKNEVVQELKKSFVEARIDKPSISEEEEQDNPKGILNWIMDSTKGKMIEFFDMISKLVSDIFHSQERKDMDAESLEDFDDFVKSSFMLSVVVFIIIVVGRIQKS